MERIHDKILHGTANVALQVINLVMQDEEYAAGVRRDIKYDYEHILIDVQITEELSKLI